MVRSVEELLRDLAESTDGLVTAADGLSDADVRAPSLLPGWARGHVLSHLARNAEGGTRLLDGARAGVPGYEYLSVATRAAEIEQGAGRPAADLAADVRQTSRSTGGISRADAAECLAGPSDMDDRAADPSGEGCAVPAGGGSDPPRGPWYRVRACLLAARFRQRDA
jgi:uncharacterized protein (TIGR03083 family)